MIEHPEIKPENLVEVPRIEGTATVDIAKVEEIANPERKRQIKIWDWIRNVSVVGLLILTINAFWVTFHRTKVLEVYNEPVPVTDQNLKPGDPLTVMINYCKFSDGFADVTPMLIGESTVFMQDYTSDVGTGCAETDFQIGYIPLYTPPGSYFLRLIVHYNVNALHTEHTVIESQTFEVTDGKVIFLP